MKEYILERFEEEYALLEDGDGCITTVPKGLVAFAKEGDILAFDGEEYALLEEKTALRKKEMQSRFNSLIKKKDVQ